MIAEEKVEQTKCDAFNSLYKVGTRVRFWSLLSDKSAGKKPLHEGQTLHPAAVLGTHTAVLWLSDFRGCVALEHCEVVPKEELE